ncbi:hypothetical protein [Wenyingzhuangia sp. 2_MG-2023]|uniref:hypothetical protein n=1 Tax=Wenyingzhuangia sp. 2_MG-2023 TaxID=3062639 RepID=UPI0026E3DF7E|nr:hypothetical protein [Wenyingzhuangia sp. 2_MG-2023]MDO6736469.1 hypothetical protein [Wenyingzhuangia sp. 2_MG-2023]MDO6801224.1 hypothetical protein [Wenyingzhuangia sp. 1_MG-2023]
MKNLKNILIGLLLLSIIGLIFYVSKVNIENNTYKQEIQHEKEMLNTELELTIEDLNVSQQQNIAITKDFMEANDRLLVIRAQLRKSKEDVEGLKKQLTNSEETSFKSLQEVKNALQEVRSGNRMLFRSLDSIKTLNDSLMVTIAVTKSELNSEKLQSKELSFKLSEATKVQIAKVEVFAIQQKESGEIKQTEKYKKVNGLQVKYNVLNNKALKNVECDIFYVLKNQEGLILASNGDFLYEGVLTKFTDGTRLILNGETMPVSDVISLSDVPLEKGTYTLEFYSLDGLLANESFELKNSFLGVF